MATITTRKWTHNGTIREAYRVTYKDQSGKTATKQFDRRKDAAEFLKTCQTSRFYGGDAKVTVAQAAERWLSACEKGLGSHVPVERSTLRGYETNIRLHINPVLGFRTLDEVTPQLCGRFRDDLLTRVSRVLANTVLMCLKGILAQAVADGSITVNPAAEVKIVKSKRERVRLEIPTIEEVRKILDTVDELSRNPSPKIAKMWRRYRVMVYATVYTGLRASEMRGLPWPNIDFAKLVLKVDQRADEYGRIGSPKSVAGYREIAFPPELATMLMEWKVECPPGVKKLALPNWQGNAESLANIHRRGWYPLQRLAGVSKKTGKGFYTWHALRHFRASVLIASGATPMEVKTEIGHGDITMTFNTYGHLFPDTKGERQRRAADIAKSIRG